MKFRLISKNFRKWSGHYRFLLTQFFPKSWTWRQIKFHAIYTIHNRLEYLQNSKILTKPTIIYIMTNHQKTSCCHVMTSNQSQVSFLQSECSPHRNLQYHEIFLQHFFYNWRILHEYFSDVIQSVFEWSFKVLNL